jgi:hypothetical protein
MWLKYGGQSGNPEEGECLPLGLVTRRPGESEKT